MHSEDNLMKARSLVAVTILLSLPAQGETAMAETQEQESPSPAVAQAGNQFAVDLYGQLSKEQPGKNLFFSPASISIALGMTAAGARGETEAEMARVLRSAMVCRRPTPNIRRCSSGGMARGKIAAISFASPTDSGVRRVFPFWPAIWL